jgi:hypothetical protein
MAAKPKRKMKLTDKKQSERFKEAARKLECNKAGEEFERAFEKIMTPKRRIIAAR